MLPCNFTSENYILIIVFKYNNYDRGMLSDLSVQMETPNSVSYTHLTLPTILRV